MGARQSALSVGLCGRGQRGAVVPREPRPVGTEKPKEARGAEDGKPKKKINRAGRQRHGQEGLPRGPPLVEGGPRGEVWGRRRRRTLPHVDACSGVVAVAIKSNDWAPVAPFPPTDALVAAFLSALGVVRWVIMGAHPDFFFPCPYAPSWPYTFSLFFFF